MHSKTSSPRCVEAASQSGTTLVELLVSATIGLLLVAAAVTLTLATRASYDRDEGRTRLNQNLRSSLDLIGIEIRQTGERLPFDVPALEIVDGASGAPDALVLRRNLLDEVLPLCESLVASDVDTELAVVETTSPPQGCAPLPDADTNGFFDNIDAWRNYRDGLGGAVWAFVYNPVDRQGEYFLYDADGTTDNTFLGKGNNDAWSRDYDVNQQCRLYMLEQRRYELDSGFLQYALNQDTASVIHLSTGITDLQITALLADGSTVTSLDHTAAWTDVAAIDVAITGTETVDGEPRTRTVSARFFPRNVLSN